MNETILCVILALVIPAYMGTAILLNRYENYKEKMNNGKDT